jgi:TatA/E family protein of Tat protein translocase
MIPSGWELVVLLAIGALLLGANRLPALARSFGQGITEFKTSIAPRSPEARGKDAQ